MGVALAQADPPAVQVAAPVALQAVVAVAECQAVAAYPVHHQGAVFPCPQGLAAEAKGVSPEVVVVLLADKQRVVAEAQAPAHRAATRALAMLPAVTHPSQA